MVVQKEETKVEKKCPECGSIDIVTHEGETFCKKCGMVIDYLDYS